MDHQDGGLEAVSPFPYDLLTTAVRNPCSPRSQASDHLGVLSDLPALGCAHLISAITSVHGAVSCAGFCHSLPF